MKINYLKESGSSYMVLSGLDEPGSSFSLKMLMSVSSPRLIPLRTEKINGESLFFYDISGKQSFGKAFEAGKLTYDLLITLIGSLKELTQDLGEHLLDEDMIMLSAETIFLDRSYNEFYFCCHPCAASCNVYSAESFFSSLPSMIDYDDKRLVALTFAVNRLFQSDNFTLYDVFREAEHLNDAPSLQPAPSMQPSPSVHTPSAENISAPAPPLHAENKPEVTKASFIDKAKVYFKGKSFSEIYDAVNSGKIIKLIKNTHIPMTAPNALPAAAAFVDTTYYSNGAVSASFEDSGHSYTDHGHSYTEKSEPSLSYGKSPLSDTASLNLSDLPFHRLTGIENALGMVIILDHFPFTIGSPGSPADHHLEWPTISRLHCRIYEEADGTFAMEDLNSKNGSSINDISLTPYEKTSLNPGSTIMLSDLKFIFF